MSNPLQHIQPAVIWENFSAINAVPRPSKKEEAIAAFMVQFGENLGLEVIQDKAMNVLIKKPATTGFENRKKVVMQSHLDMVHQKNDDTVFDFLTEGIKMRVDGDWVKAQNTTLGADNGIGVAAIMSVLASTDIEHPAIEALFTIDEETGMTGAFELQPDFLSGEILLNLDTEEDDEITIGCAGGIDITATKKYTPVNSTKTTVFDIQLTGLNGGHSGIEIHKGLGNSNKVLARVLFELNKIIAFDLFNFKGGNLRNAIPREANALIAIDEKDLVLFKNTLKTITTTLKKEFIVIDDKLSIDAIESTNNGLLALSEQDKIQFINTLYSTKHGVHSMDYNIKDLVATSNNLSAVHCEDGQIAIKCLTRSSIESEKTDLANTLEATFNLGGFTTKMSDGYPGWQPNPSASIIKVMENIYKDLFNAPPHVNACHAGLECGIIGTHYPEMEMVSFGPTIHGAHTPEERVSISSTQKFWKYLIEILKNIPVK